MIAGTRRILAMRSEGPPASEGGKIGTRAQFGNCTFRAHRGSETKQKAPKNNEN